MRLGGGGEGGKQQEKMLLLGFGDNVFLLPLLINLLKKPKNLFHRFLKQVVNLSCLCWKGVNTEKAYFGQRTCCSALVGCSILTVQMHALTWTGLVNFRPGFLPGDRVTVVCWTKSFSVWPKRRDDWSKKFYRHFRSKLERQKCYSSVAPVHHQPKSRNNKGKEQVAWTVPGCVVRWKIKTSATLLQMPLYGIRGPH